MRSTRTTRLICRERRSRQSAEEPRPYNVEADPDDYSEDFETGLYLCRWPDGGFSFVVAESRLAAVVQLDEWRAANPRWLTPIDGAMIDFRLNDRGEICLARFGDETATAIWRYCYPVLDEVLTEFGGLPDRSAKRNIRRAVAHEQTRLAE